MATKKIAPKKAAPVKKAVAAKKAAPAKAVAKAAPVKKVAPSKTATKAAPAKAVAKAAPVKKAAPAKTATKAAPAKAVAKAAPVKKAAPAKTATKAAPAKAVAKAAPVKKAAPAKTATKAAPTKATPAKGTVKAATAPTKANEPVKPVEKYVPPVKAAPKVPTAPVKPVRKTEEPIKEIKVPKITAKGSVPYQPGYVPMEKRKEVEKSTETLIRYTDAELLEFKEVVLKKLEELKNQVAYYKDQMRHTGAFGGDIDDARYMTMEDGTVSMERELLASKVSQNIGVIQKLEFALMRIENKTYGICRVTGMKIPKERLLSVPHTTTTVEGKGSEKK